MSPSSAVRFHGAEVSHDTEPKLPDSSDDFVADPPETLIGPTTGLFVGEAKSPHGISRAGVAPIAIPAPRAPLPVSRRPVVALVDTAIGHHPWLQPTVGGGGMPTPFWQTAAFTPTVSASKLANDKWPHPMLRAYGHGTFIAGIIRQLAPDARVLSLPVMNDSGLAATVSVLDALHWLLDRVTTARKEKRSDLFVDVVNLSFGWYQDKNKKNQEFPLAEHRELLAALGNAGVQVVASAGNRSINTPVYPAAFAREQVDDPNGPRTPLVSVGALDPDGSLAAYSNTGDWVRLLAPGTGLISTVPPASGVPWSPTRDQQGNPMPNPNHQARGFARWGGTSFAAAWVSAKLAAHLLDGPYGSRLDDLKVDAVHRRAAAALDAVEADIEDWRRWPSG